MRNPNAPALFALAIVSFLAGCSGNGTATIEGASAAVPDLRPRLAGSVNPNVSPEYVYVSNAASNNVSIYSIGSGGILNAIGSVAAGSGARGEAIGINKYLYVANSGSNNVSAWKIGASGALTPVLGSPFAAGSNPIGMAYKGKCVFAANEGSNNVSAFRISGSNGVLTLVGNYPAGSGPVNAAADPLLTANYLFVTNEGSSSVTSYSIGPSCKVTPIASYSTGGTGPFGIAVDPTGTYVVIANLGSSSVSFFTIGSIGGLTFNGMTTTGAASPVGVAISGGYALVANENSNVVAAYTTGGSFSGTYATDNYPQGLAIDPTGSYAYVANEFSNDVSAYTISAGVLTPTVPATFAAGTGPEYVATCQKVGNSCVPPPL